MSVLEWLRPKYFNAKMFTSTISKLQEQVWLVTYSIGHVIDLSLHVVKFLALSSSALHLVIMLRIYLVLN